MKENAIEKQHNWKKMVRDTFTDRVFLGKALMVALPVTLQNLLNTVTQMVDTIMIGSLGASALAAVGLANKYFFVFGLLNFGICSGSSVLAAQFFGNRDMINIRKVLGLAILLACAGSLFFFFPALLIPYRVMRIFTDSTAACELGAQYLRIVCFTYILNALGVAMIFMMRATGSAKTAVYTSILAIIVNIFLNYALIFGHFGLPRMGVRGAAVATLAARIVETAALSCVVFRKGSIFRGKPGEFFGWSRIFISTFLSTTLPVIGNEFLWGLGTTLYSVAYGRMGDNAVAAMTIAATIEELMMVAWFGLSSATAVLLGNELGAGKLEEAEDYAGKFLVLSLSMAVIVIALLFFMRRPVTGLFHADAEVAELVVRILNRLMLVLVPKSLNTIIVVGVLRSGGDTRWCLFLDTSGVWLIGVPLAFLGALVWKLPIYSVFMLVSLEELYKVAFGLWRVSTKKWIRNIAIEVQ